MARIYNHFSFKAVQSPELHVVERETRAKK
jgi:hypothetical protein